MPTIFLIGYMGCAFHQMRPGVAARVSHPAQGSGRRTGVPRPLCQEHHRGRGGQPAPSAHRPSGRAVHPLAEPGFWRVPAGRDHGSHDEAEGAGQDPRHRCFQRYLRHHPDFCYISSRIKTIHCSNIL